MKLNVGNYVKTKNEGIGKIIKIEPFMNDIHIFLDSKKGNITFQSKDGVFKVNNEQNIVKSSPNIIDLIEVGDYVNGEKVGIIEGDAILTEAITNAGIDGRYIYPEDIKSVVTKEQFEQMEYKIGDDNE